MTPLRPGLGQAAGDPVGSFTPVDLGGLANDDSFHSLSVLDSPCDMDGAIRQGSQGAVAPWEDLLGFVFHPCDLGRARRHEVRVKD